ncbi:unnamed protein product [Arabidopsis lyrata]|nr:unnamed protein product [Arabidopsis lyrata]
MIDFNRKKCSLLLAKFLHLSALKQRGEMIEQRVTWMMTIIDLSRNIHERHSVKEMIVAHRDAEFLNDM